MASSILDWRDALTNYIISKLDQHQAPVLVLDTIPCCAYCSRPISPLEGSIFCFQLGGWLLVGIACCHQHVQELATTLNSLLEWIPVRSWRNDGS